jgi:hypothetical protein
MLARRTRHSHPCQASWSANNKFPIFLLLVNKHLLAHCLEMVLYNSISMKHTVAFRLVII